MEQSELGPAVASNPSRLSRLLFPRGVRVWHFILLPSIGMGAFLLVFREVDRLLLPWFMRNGYPDAYMALRGAGIATLMASLIAYLAIRYRTDYEAKLEARNRALASTRDFLARIIEDSAEAIVTRDDAGKITSWNPAAEAIYGWTAEEMMGQGIDRLLPPGEVEREAFADLDRRLAAGETIRDFETTRVRKDGKRIVVQLTMSPIRDRAGRRVGSSGIVRDVTRLKEMEGRLVERERLAAIGELAAVVAHEVRNPLAGIRGGCELMLEGYPDADPRHEIGVEILHQVDRLSRTVTELLMYARPKAMDPVPTALHGLIDRVVGVLREDADNRGVVIEKRYGPDIPPVRIDGRLMEQVFLNLVLNAMQAMGHAGKIIVSTAADPERVAISFADSGPGIPAEQLDHIFKPFYTTRAQGTGLGLAIVKKIVEAHGGSVEASNDEGGGARFTVSLPRES